MTLPTLHAIVAAAARYVAKSIEPEPTDDDDEPDEVLAYDVTAGGS